MTFNDNWFTEAIDDLGVGFSLKLGDAKKLHEEQSEFQKIEVYATETFGNLMVIDGCTMVTTRDNFLYHEMMSHPVLFTHPDPRRVLIIGGGDCGTLREVLKHESIETAHLVDIDERVTRVSEMFFPELCESNSDDRAGLYFEDGINWIKQAEPGSYDVIIVDSTDPVGPGEILFTEEFFRHCHRALSEQGMVVQQSESPLLHGDSIIKSMHQRLMAAGFGEPQTLNFPQPIYPSGWWSCTLACKSGDIPDIDTARVAKSSFITHYYNIEIHRAAMAMPEFLKRILANR